MSSPTLFHVAVDSVVQHWLSLLVEYESNIHDSLRMAVGRSMGVFYVYNGLVGSRYLQWLQGYINVLIRLFYRVVLMANFAKSNTITFQQGLIRTGMSEEAFSRRITGEGAPYQELIRRRIPCPHCRV